MTLERVKQRHLSLGFGELVSAAIFLVVARRYDERAGERALWSALFPLVVILVQAGCYWLLARRWVGHSLMPAPIARTYRTLRVVNLAVLVLGFVGVIAWFPAHAGAAFVTIAVWIFGVIEYLNYFVVRLAYPVGRWLPEVQKRRIPQLVQDFRASARS